MIEEAIGIVKGKRDLTASQMAAVFGEIMGGVASHDQMKSFLIALADKGESVTEITEAARVMRGKMAKLDLPHDEMLDTCGTGGGSSTFNVSTTVAIVVSGLGIKVAKHGNRSYTSHCGSADILEHLGVKIDISPEKAAKCIDEIGVAFLFAPLYHSAMKHVVGVRREIKRRTIFNILGPLCNPASASAQLIGVFDPKLTDVMAGVLKNLGSKRALVVHGMDGFDEVSISDETQVSELKDGKVTTYRIAPEDFGIKRAKKGDVACKNIEDNLRVVRSILNREPSVHRDMLLMNASAALNAAGFSKDLKEGVKDAAGSIDSGKAQKQLEGLVRLTNS